MPRPAERRLDGHCSSVLSNARPPDASEPSPAGAQNTLPDDKQAGRPECIRSVISHMNVSGDPGPLPDGLREFGTD